MLHDLLTAYLERVERTIGECDRAYVEQYVEEILTPKRANLRIRLRFDWGYLLEVSEAVVVEDGRLVPLDYRYHCQDGANRLVFRYDCTPHFPDLAGFPHHKHLPDAVSPSSKPDIDDVVREAAAAGSWRNRTRG